MYYPKNVLQCLFISFSRDILLVNPLASQANYSMKICSLREYQNHTCIIGKVVIPIKVKTRGSNDGFHTGIPSRIMNFVLMNYSIEDRLNSSHSIINVRNKTFFDNATKCLLAILTIEFIDEWSELVIRNFTFDDKYLKRYEGSELTPIRTDFNRMHDSLRLIFKFIAIENSIRLLVGMSYLNKTQEILETVIKTSPEAILVFKDGESNHYLTSSGVFFHQGVTNAIEPGKHMHKNFCSAVAKRKEQDGGPLSSYYVILLIVLISSTCFGLSIFRLCKIIFCKHVQTSEQNISVSSSNSGSIYDVANETKETKDDKEKRVEARIKQTTHLKTGDRISAEPPLTPFYRWSAPEKATNEMQNNSTFNFYIS